MKAVALSLLLLIPYGGKRADVPVPPGVWKHLGQPKDGEWLDKYREEGQTFAEYKASAARPPAARTTLYVVPMLTRPATDPGLPERVRASLAAFYGRPAKLLEPRAIPLRAYNRRRRQVQITGLARAVAARRPKDALITVAMTDRDLYSKGLNYVHGWGSERLGVAIVSTARVWQSADPEGSRRRLLAMAVHEAGHVLALRHCTFYHCLMNGVATRDEERRRPLLLCPVCRSKLLWALELDTQERYGAWARYLRGQGLEKDARLVDRAAAATRKASR